MTLALGGYRVMDISILDSIKEVIGIDKYNTDFNTDLVLAINAVLFILYQEGLADENYKIRDDTKTWDEILLHGVTPDALSAIIEWTALKTKMLFDPPTSSVLAQAIKDNISELEWRAFITNNYVGEIGSIYSVEE